MPKHTNYDEAEYRYFRDHTGSERLDDAGSIFLARELDALRARIYDQETVQYNALNVFPVQSEAAGWQDTLTVRVIGSFGMARIISDYSDNIPMVGIWGSSATVTLYTVADAYAFSTAEIEKAIATGKQLSERLAVAARRGVDAKINDLVWNGDADYGIVGVFDHPNITHMAGSDWTAAAGAGAANMLSDLNKAISEIMRMTKGLHNANAIVFPIAAQQILTTQLPNTSISYKTYLTQENPGLQISFAQELDDIDLDTGATGKGAVLVFEKSVDVAAIELSQPFRQHPAQWNNLHAKVVCDAKTGGLIVYQPLCMILIKDMLR